MLTNQFWIKCSRLVPVLLLLVQALPAGAQMLADFESPGTRPPITAEGGASVVANPDKSGINTSDSVGFYNKISGNWHYVSLHFPDTVNIRNNNTLTFKLRTTTKGRIYAKFYFGSEVPIEGWAPEWNFMPEPGDWVECRMDLTPAMGKDFTLLQLAACVDNEAEAEVWFDDVRLSNPEAALGPPHVEFETSSGKAVPGDTVTFDASGSYDYDGELVAYAWDFGDGTLDSGTIVNHVYQSEQVYSPVLTITDNDGKSASTAQYVFIVPADGRPTPPRIISGGPETNRKIEAVFGLMGPYDNVYDPDEVRIDAVITAPGGDSVVVPCFWYEQAAYEGGRWETGKGLNAWMVRFICEESGHHSISLRLTDDQGTRRGDTTGFDVAAGTASGVIRRDPVNGQYYRHATGEAFYPLGINVAWNDLDTYTQIINNLSAGKANIFRYWMTPFSWQALEWSDNSFYAGWNYRGLGKYNQEAAAMADSLLVLCEADDVYMQMSIFSHGSFSENVDAQWNDNPYNAANGGYVDRAEKFFYNADCKTQVKKQLRYIVARWAWAKNLFAWEFFNEVQFTGEYLQQSPAWSQGVMAWHSEMSRYLASIDPWDHLQTTSADEDQIAVMDTIASLDNLQYHLYIDGGVLLETQAGLDHDLRTGLSHVSVINGEYGTNSEADTPFDLQRNAIWTGIMTQVPRYMWVWSHYVQPSWANLFKMPAEYLGDEDLAGEEGPEAFGLPVSHPDKELGSYAMSSEGKYYGYIFDPDYGTGISGAAFSIDDLPLGIYDLTWYLPVSGVVLREDSIAPVFDDNSFDLPEFSKALAFKLKYREPYTAPFAEAGNDTVLPMGGTARLSGAMSHSDSSGTFTYLWQLSERPDSSLAVLNDSTGMTLNFTPDVAGTYKLDLVVNDGRLDSRPDRVTVRMSAPPLSVAGNDTTVALKDDRVRLNGTDSHDPDGESLTYAWKLLSFPEGSQAQLIGGTVSGLVTLDYDLEGIYEIELTVNDNYQDGPPDTVLVTVLNTAGTGGIAGKSGFGVYPNPTSGRIFITHPAGTAIGSVEVFDTEGRLLQRTFPHSFGSSAFELELDIPAGNSRLLMIRITGPGICVYRTILLVRRLGGD